MSRKKVSLIVGAGLAGITAADTLRTEGFDGDVIVVGEEATPPYDHPPLSKGYLRGENSADEIALRPSSFYEERHIELVQGRTVTSLDVHAAEISFADGRRMSFDAALLATGAAPRALQVPGADLQGVHLLRTRHDADRLAADAASAKSAVIIGAGWIGSEVAASLRQIGKDVTIVTPDAVPLQRVLGPQIGHVFAGLHADHGVNLRLGRSVTELRGTCRVGSVVLDDGSAIGCDLVVVGIGVTPREELARDAGIACDNGVLVDEKLRTNGSNVYAAGDVANAMRPRYGRLRVEHWANARDQGAAAARSMLGNEERSDSIPHFFSDQYDLSLGYTGHGSASDEVVVRGDLASREFIAFWLRNDRVTAGMNVNVGDVTKDIERFIRSDVAVDPVALADIDTPLRSVVGRKRVT